jgi:phytoene synthase
MVGIFSAQVLTMLFAENKRKVKPPAATDGGEACRLITKKYGTSFYFATQFFPMDNGASDDAVLDFIAKSFLKFKIPMDDCEAFLRSMFMDEEKFTYADYAELEDYMYGSAGVIGLMVTRVVGYSSENAFEYAKKLGFAFQLTNFLRDIREDCDDLGRIYMPANELQYFGLSHSDIRRHVRDERFEKFMKFQIARNRKLYREALPGIKLLNWRGRLAVRVAYVLYKAILREIERANYNVYAGRVRTNRQQKIYLSLKALAGVYE